MDAPPLLRDGLLAGVRIVVAHPAEPSAAALAAGDEAAALGADVRTLHVDPGAAEEPAAEHPDGVVLVWDGAGAFAAAGSASVAGVRAALDGAWLAVRPAAAAAGAKVLLIAPPPGTPHHEAARAGLENLARTLGIEWARFGIRTVALLPGERTPPAALAQLVAYLASPAGDYFSGCALTLT